jgi:hypothetical protein
MSASNPVGGLLNFDKAKDFIETTPALLNLLSSYSSDGLDYIYDLEPQSQNLFYAGFFGENGTSNPLYNAAYRIQSVSFNLPKLGFKHQKFTHMPQLDSKDYDISVTIGWLEDVKHSIKNYHLNWMDRWYSRELDVLRCGAPGKFRKMSIVAFHYVNANASAETSIIEVPEIQPILAIEIAGMVPEGIGDMKFDHSNGNNEEILSISYKASRVRWAYTTDVNLSSWNPTGYTVDNAGQNNEAPKTAEFDYFTKQLAEIKVI